ncbi:MAG: phenylalanine--tRNA ligase subunit beta [Desulfobacteraceae bacterium]|nr:phenylalanine--tRNA ligase subunit beta [Desulfobacteraceae bacterium]
MKISVSWLQQYVPLQLDIEALVDSLTMVGLEVESVFDRYAYLTTVRVGKVVEVGPHPNADRLQRCRVETGREAFQVICGAPNVREGQRVALALPGTQLPDGRILTEGVIRGEASFGMICSEMELGLGPDASGIMVLDPALSVGDSLKDALALSDTVLDIDLTPNRPDCLSVVGIAREVAAIQGTEMSRPDTGIDDREDRISQMTSVTIDAPKHCPRYAARLVTGVTVGPSPFWIQDRLLSVGLRPINNIVDVTNFVMMEMGQPLHAFDFDHLAGHRIVVRTARKGEPFVTLDEKERLLDEDMLMICDGEKPVAVGGVMGGLNSEIEEGTSRVLIESACFSPVSIRRTARKLGLGTEASHRFERGVDPAGTVEALNRAARLIAELGGGRIEEGLIDVHPRPWQPKRLNLSIAETNRLLGIDLSEDEMRRRLESIGFRVERMDDASLSVLAPSFRVDVSRPEDLMEEIARLSGYDRIPATFPPMTSVARAPSRKQELRRRVREALSGFGFAEAINYSFISRESCDILRLPTDDPRRRMIGLLNPLSEDPAVLRTSMVPGLLDTIRRNIAWQVRDLRLFEIGRVYFDHEMDDRPAHEEEILAGVWTGRRRMAGWSAKETDCDFYDTKGTAESLLHRLWIPGVVFTAMESRQCYYTRPGRTASLLIEDKPSGLVGEVHPEVLGRFDIKQPVFLFEIHLNRLLASAPDTVTARPLPKYPATSRDVTLIIDRDLESQSVLRTVVDMEESLVEDVRLFDVYEGQPIPRGKKSISFRILYRSSEKTLEDETVNRLHKDVTDRLLSVFSATLPE